jgi:hypothetical protein
VLGEAERLRCVSVHSVKGGVGKSSVAWLLAQRFVQEGPVLLVDFDLTGTSLADVLALEAPDTGEGGALDLCRAPAAFLDVETSRTRMEQRALQPGWAPWGVPLLNDFLLAEPKDPYDPAYDHQPLSLAWRVRDLPDLRVLPSSALPRDLVAILPIIYDELRAAYLESRIEWLLELLLRRTASETSAGVRTVVFDAPPTIPGLSAALLSLAMRLPDRVHLVPDAPASSPPRLFQDVDVSWTPLLIVSPDHQDLRAAERWLVGREEAEIARLQVVVNGREGDEAMFLNRLRYALVHGHEPPTVSTPAGYTGDLLSERCLTLARQPDFQPWRPGLGPSATLPGLDQLFERVRG